jgi:hypothetical protein
MQRLLNSKLDEELSTLQEALILLQGDYDINKGLDEKEREILVNFINIGKITEKATTN